MQEKIRVIRIHPGEGVLVLASEPEPPVPPCPMAMAVPEAQESDALLYLSLIHISEPTRPY